jgi:hypothetical protein
VDASAAQRRDTNETRTLRNPDRRIDGSLVAGLRANCRIDAGGEFRLGLHAGPKKAVKKKIAKKAPASPVADEEENEPDVSGTKVVDYQCELGNKITIFTNNDDDKHIALKWGKRLHRMARIDTSTGANRFENRHFGLVWIGIPAKGMLLDSKNGHQLANECKTDEQRAAQASTPPKA